MFNLSVNRLGKVLKADSTFKLSYTDTHIDDCYSISGSRITAEDAESNCFVAALSGKDGRRLYALLHKIKSTPTVINYQGFDITQDMNLVMNMRGKYICDEVTGLFNRYKLEEDCDALIANNSPDMMMIRIKIFNIDEFKLMLGEYFINELIKKIAGMIVALFSNDCVYRINENEFVILKDSGSLYLNAKMKQLSALRNKVISINERMVILDISVGGVDFSNSGRKDNTLDFEQMMNISRLAVDYARRSIYTNQYVYKFYQGIAPIDYKAVGVIEKMLSDGDFEVHYQPQVDIKTGKTVCFEALTRIRSADKKNITPAEIISIAEQYGGILDLGEFVFEESMRFAKSLQMHGFNVGVSINVSTIQLLERGFVKRFLDYFYELNLPKDSIHIEITETAMMHSMNDILPKLQLLIEGGIDIHLDDFGTGYSSLSYLRRIPASTIKVDKSFIDDIAISQDSEIIVNNIIMICKKLRKSVIAEGVETLQQVEILRKQGCDIIQGFVYSKALPQQEAIEYLNKKKGTV